MIKIFFCFINRSIISNILHNLNTKIWSFKTVYIKFKFYRFGTFGIKTTIGQISMGIWHWLATSFRAIYVNAKVKCDPIIAKPRMLRAMINQMFTNSVTLVMPMSRSLPLKLIPRTLDPSLTAKINCQHF